MARLFCVVAVLLLAPLFAATARAQTPSTCEDVVGAWARRCPELRNECALAVLCPPGSVVFEAGCRPEDRLRVEVSRASPRAFRRVGEVGISPVGNFADWSEVPEGRRRVEGEIEACLAKDASLLMPVSAATATEPNKQAPPANAPVPWRLIVGIALGLVVVAHAGRARLARDPATKTPAFLGALFVGTLVFRALAFPLAFFHPNGQGAFWIGFTLDANGRYASYGPGFWEMFGWLAQLPIGRPEDLVMGAHAILGALSPVCAWVIVREMGGRLWLAWAVSIAAAASPILARISNSQAYYGTWTSLLFIAAAVLVVGVPRRSEKPGRFILAVASAGLMVAQAARVTPIGWTAAAVVPLTIIAKPGSATSRLRWCVLAGLGMAAVVALTSGQAMIGVLRGALGSQWLPQANGAGSDPWRLVLFALPLVFALVVASKHRSHTALRATMLFVTLGLMDATNMVRGQLEIFQRAFAAMWSPVLLCLVAALVADLRTRTLRVVASAGILTALAAMFATTWRADRALPTNALEARFAEEWREKLPPGSTVVYLGRVGQNVLVLPLYGAYTRVKVDSWVLANDEALPDLQKLGPNVYYYESSLCEAREARDYCRRLHERFAGAPIEATTLPARSSAAPSFFERSTAPVALYRIP